VIDEAIGLGVDPNKFKVHQPLAIEHEDESFVQLMPFTLLSLALVLHPYFASV